MKRWPQFSLGYLLLVVSCWALALSLTREYVEASHRGDEHALACFLLALPAWGMAYGGACVRLRFGLIAGVLAAVGATLFLIWSSGHNF
jgi:hypothetical protein